MGEFDKWYVPYTGQAHPVRQMSKNVYYIGSWTGFGPLFPASQIWRQKQTGIVNPGPGQTPYFRNRDCAEKALDKALESLKDCLLFSTTPTYFSQYQNACLLKSRGFEVLEGKCYKNPQYTGLFTAQQHPGETSGYTHWEHIWWKVLGKPVELGPPLNISLNNCGVAGLAQDFVAKRHEGSSKNVLAVGWLPRGTLFPKGWKRFFSATDFKLGVNFDSEHVKNVQACPHKFDLKIFEDWHPDFSKWTPS